MNSSIPAVMVTGATGGIGSAIVRALYAKGEPVIVAACRCPERLSTFIADLREQFPTSTSRIIPHTLDLSSFSAVKKSACELIKNGIRLRALINNAGTMPLLHHITRDGHEEATQVNYLSTVLLTRLLLPVVTDGGTIVFTVSVTRRLASPRYDFDTKAITARSRMAHFMNYARSKSLLAHYALELSAELKSRNIAVCCSDPGVVDSGIITLGIPIVDKAADILFRPLISTPDQGAAPALEALAAPATGTIYTSRHRSMLPVRWRTDSAHQAAYARTNTIYSSIIST